MSRVLILSLVLSAIACDSAEPFEPMCDGYARCAPASPLEPGECLARFESIAGEMPSCQAAELEARGVACAELPCDQWAACVLTVDMEIMADCCALGEVKADDVGAYCGG